MNPIVNTKKNPPAADGADSSLATGSTNSAAPSAAADATPASTVNVAYFDGPPSFGYFGSRWERGKAKPISAADWAAMQERSDCAPHDFRVV